HPDFRRRVFLEYAEQLAAASSDSPLQHLMLFKAAIRAVARRLAADHAALPAAESKEDRLGIVLKLIRSMECGLPGEVSKCLVRYPALREKVPNPCDFSGNLTVRLRELRQHAAELARDHALDELATATVSEEERTRLDESSLDRALRTRKRGARLLHRLAPGRTVGIGAVADDRGNVLTNADDMVGELRSHWQRVFQRKGHDSQLLREWLEEDQRARPPGCGFLALPDDLRLTRRHMRRALRITGNTSPGPDGIPFSVWRSFGDTAVDLLYGAFQGLTAAGATSEME
ncbi:unnamed protein product, partial [Prorocentrum cordatum]